MAYRPIDVILIDVLENAVKFSVALIHETPIAVLLRCHVFICVAKEISVEGKSILPMTPVARRMRKRLCPSLSGFWTMMLPPSSWWTATCSGKACSQERAFTYKLKLEDMKHQGGTEI